MLAYGFGNTEAFLRNRDIKFWFTNLLPFTIFNPHNNFHVSIDASNYNIVPWKLFIYQHIPLMDHTTVFFKHSTPRVISLGKDEKFILVKIKIFLTSLLISQNNFKNTWCPSMIVLTLGSSAIKRNIVPIIYICICIYTHSRNRMVCLMVC